MTVVRFISPASWELQEQLQRYGVEDAARGARFSQAVLDTLDLAMMFHRAGGRTHRQLRQLLCKSFPYSVIYLPQGKEIMVFAVAHQARRPGYWVDRVREPRAAYA